MLVFVHGLLVNGALWSKVVPLLSDRYRCITPDLPLGSHSIPVGGELSPYGVSDMIGELIRELGLEDVTLVGNDTGGALCQMFVVAQPRGREATGAHQLRRVRPVPAAAVQVPELGPEDPRRDGLLAASMRLRANRRLPIAFGWLAKRMPRDVEDAFVDPVIRNKAIRADIAGFLRRVRQAGLGRHRHGSSVWAVTRPT